MGLQDIGFTEPTPIQEKSIPLILSGQDVLGAAQTGTGKTGAFVIPILNQILSEPKEGTKALILSPTRELAQQIDEQIFALGYHTGLSSSTIIGGEDFSKQAEAIRAGVDLIVATPGRLIDQMKVLDVDFSHIKYLILDEADRMLDMGFLPDVNHIIDKLPKERQTLLFSATMPKEIQNLAQKIQKNPELIKIAMSKPSNSVAQRAYQVDGREKLKLTQFLLDELEWTSCIIFTATKRGTDQLERLLSKKGINVASIHGDRSQDERTKALNSFKNGKVPIIVATDVLARGIDIADVSLIINYDVPQAVDDYIHRIGRTGRYDKSGMAITLVSKKDSKLFRPIKDKAGKDLEIIDGDALLKSGSSGSGDNQPKKSSEKLKRKQKPEEKTDSKTDAPKEESKAKKADSQEVKAPDFSNVKSLDVSKNEEGNYVFTLKNKPSTETTSQEKPAKAKTAKKESKSAPKKQAAKQAKAPSKKQEKQPRGSKESRAPKKKIEIKKIDKAAERNKKAHKPAKGIWGLIKSFLPKF
ncbi:MAG: DEAD/DEAH box helicase [Balneolaceae bacterium]|nr:DEAD/DEAH box helicase [Balneolaceae bacterium]